MKSGSLLAFRAGGLVGYSLTRACSRDHRIRLHSAGKHIVVLGAVFGGLSAASKLLEMAGDQVRVSLVDQHSYHLFTPMLYQVATCGVVPYGVANPLRAFTGPRGIHFRKASVETLDFERKIVKTDTGEIGYDFLIIALGSTTNYFGNAAAQQYSFPLKSLEGGLAIRNRVIDVLEQATLSSDRAARVATDLRHYWRRGNGSGNGGSFGRRCAPHDPKELSFVNWV